MKETLIPSKAFEILKLPHLCFRKCFLTQGIKIRVELKEAFYFYPELNSRVRSGNVYNKSKESVEL